MVQTIFGRGHKANPKTVQEVLEKAKAEVLERALKAVDELGEAVEAALEEELAGYLEAVSGLRKSVDARAEAEERIAKIEDDLEGLPVLFARAELEDDTAEKKRLKTRHKELRKQLEAAQRECDKYPSRSEALKQEREHTSALRELAELVYEHFGMTEANFLSSRINAAERRRSARIKALAQRCIQEDRSRGGAPAPELGIGVGGQQRWVAPEHQAYIHDQEEAS